MICGLYLACPVLKIRFMQEQEWRRPLDVVWLDLSEESEGLTQK